MSWLLFLDESGTDRSHSPYEVRGGVAVHTSRFVRQMERYFTRTKTGRDRTSVIVPVPLFVASDMTLPVQAADLAIYCVNRGFRLPKQGMDAPVREEIAEEFGPWLRALQYHDRVEKDGRTFDSYGIVFVPNPYGDGRKKEKEKGGKAFQATHEEPPRDPTSAANDTENTPLVQP